MTKKTARQNLTHMAADALKLADRITKLADGRWLLELADNLADFGSIVAPEAIEDEDASIEVLQECIQEGAIDIRCAQAIVDRQQWSLKHVAWSAFGEIGE